MFTARYELNLRVMYINPSKPSGLYTYHQFNIQQFYFLPTQSIYVCCVDLRTAIISIYKKNHFEAIFCPMIPTSDRACLPLMVHRLRSFVILVIDECGALLDGY